MRRIAGGAGTAIYEITDGASTVSFLAPSTGLHLMGVDQSVPEAKDGGVYQNSPLADGKRLVMRFFDNIVDTLTLAADNENQDLVIEDEQRLRRLLEKAVDYWTTRNRIDIGPVWIKRRGADETNTSYAIIYAYSSPKTGNPFAQPFFSINPVTQVQLAIEHGFWSNNPPTESDCVKIFNMHSAFTTQTPITVAVAASADDGSGNSATSVFSITNNDLYIGHAPAGTTYSSGCRFVINIPKNAIIVRAYIQFCASDTLAGDNCNVRISYQTDIYGGIFDAPVLVADYADYTARLRSTEYVDWAAVPHWVLNTNYNSCDVGSLIQRIVSDNNWVSGYHALFFIDNNSSSNNANRCFYSFDGAGAHRKPTLYVEYVSLPGVDGTPTCLEEVFVTNKFIKYPLTHMFRSGDATNLLTKALPYLLLEAVPTTGNFLYIGSEFVDGCGPFDSVIFNISIASSDLEPGVWEYYNGGWVTLLVQDDVADFSKVGVYGVYWNLPSDWATTAINGITAYWIRYVIGVTGGDPTPPTEALYDPYNAICPYVDITATEILGDVLALLKMRIHNISDDHGDDPGTPYTQINKILLGIRSLARGSNFSAYLPLSTITTNGIVGETVTLIGSVGPEYNLVGGSTSVIYNPTGVDTATSSVRVVLDASITSEYIGKFALYIRVRQVGGTLGDLSAQIDVMLSKSTGFPLLFRSDKVYPAALSRNEMLYLGMLEIPSDTPLYEFGNIRIQVNVENNPAAADGDLYLYDLILMPADECLISVEGNSTSENCVGYTFAENRIQFIDSITNPKRKVFAEVRGVNIYTGDESSVTDISIPIYNNALSIFPNSAQRIWFCVESDDNDPLYRVVFETVFTVMIEKQQRYLAMRGTK